MWHEICHAPAIWKPLREYLNNGSHVLSHNVYSYIQTNALVSPVPNPVKPCTSYLIDDLLVAKSKVTPLCG